MLYTALAAYSNYGWGVCSANLNRELAKITPTHVLRADQPEWYDSHLPGPLFSCLFHNPMRAMAPARGETNFGYTFFEHEVTAQDAQTAWDYEIVFAGSSWCLEKLRERGIAHAELLVQGVDPEIFYPIDRPEYRRHGHFVIFSGGTLSHRKGHDLVIAAVKVMQDRHPDVVLVNAWESVYSHLDAIAANLKASPHIKFSFQGGNWVEKVTDLCRVNGLDLDRVLTLPNYPHAEMADMCRNATIGLFPNRCESGTNLVMMEFMACGRPVIATAATGHLDVIDHASTFPLTDLREVPAQSEIVAKGMWQEPSLDEVVAALEKAYADRERLIAMGWAAAERMAGFTWAKMARRLVGFVEKY